ncbi:MAG: hypothetical protein GC189_07060 [Alphaproteobacteria bacterium]|nr:hypothetical protein [Alphaproteobacteria bacterium]
MTAEAQHWKQIRHSRNAEDFLRHLAQFGPDGAFSELAQMRLDELQAQPPRAAASRAPRRPTQPAPTPPAAAAPRPVAPPRPAAPAPRPVARPAPAPMPPAGASIEPVWGEGAPLAAPRRPEPVQPAMGGFEPRYEPQQRPIYVDRAPVEPRRAGGMGRVVVVLAILGAGALGAGMWAGGGLSGLSLAGVTASNAPGDGEDWAAPVEQAEAATGTEGLTALAATTTQDASPAVAPAGVGGIEEDEPPPRPRTTASAAPSTFRPAQENSAALAPLPTPAAQVTPASAPQLQAPTPTPPQVRLRPGAVTWADRPSASRISALFPARALRENVSGRAELDCLILTTYQARCVVVSESPQGYGFGQAAMRASGGFRAERALDDGSPAVGARTRVAITFRAE